MAKAYVRKTRTTTRRKVNTVSTRKKQSQKRCPNCGKYMK